MRITDDFCEGRAFFVQPPDGDTPKVRGVQALQDIADDLNTIASGLQVTGAALSPAAANPPTKTEFDAVVARVNAIQTAVNAIAAATLKTVNAAGS